MNNTQWQRNKALAKHYCDIMRQILRREVPQQRWKESLSSLPLVDQLPLFKPHTKDNDHAQNP